MTLQSVAAAFEALGTTEARMALAPLLALGLGLVLFLVCDVVDALRPARAACFLASARYSGLARTWM